MVETSNKIDRVTLSEWLSVHWPQPRACPSCQVHNQWTFADTYVFVNVGGVVSVDSKLMLMVAAACDNCGYTMFWNAFKLGLVER